MIIIPLLFIIVGIILLYLSKEGKVVNIGFDASFRETELYLRSVTFSVGVSFVILGSLFFCFFC